VLRRRLRNQQPRARAAAEHFGEWIAQAEMSGIRALQEFAQRLRGCPLKPG
jgi:hypothetical protein